MCRKLVVLCAALVPLGCLTLAPLFVPKVRDVEPGLSSAFPYESRFVDVRGARMHWVEAGDGPPIVLVHGTPTSSYLWRNVIPQLTGGGRVMAVDLIGYGQSDKPEIAYRFVDEVAYFDGFMDALALDDVALVLHDWGAGIGVDWAMRHEERVRAIAVMEPVLRPGGWEHASPAERGVFEAMRRPGEGERLNLDENVFVERLLPVLSGRALTDEEMAHYRAPFVERAHRRVILQAPREIPLDGVPADNQARMTATWRALAASDVPLLLLVAEPGAIMKPAVIEAFRDEIPRIEVRSVGGGLHFLQETQPTRIGREVAAWIGRVASANVRDTAPGR